MKQGVIIGAGISGLTTALALKKQGFLVKIYEQAPILSAVGAGIWVGPNALTILDLLGVKNDILQAGKLIDDAFVCDSKENPFNHIDGKWLKTQFGHSICPIHRAALHKILLNHIGEEIVFTNKKLNRIEEKGNRVKVFFEDGSEDEADFLIGSDGLHSQVRKYLFGEIPYRYSGQTCWRGVTNMKLPQNYIGKALELWANENGVRLGFSAISENEIYFYITQNAPKQTIVEKDNLKEYLLDLMRYFPAIGKQLIENTDENKIIQGDLQDIKPLKQWTKNNITLLGDAAHPMLPNLGQGGSQAIEDAYSIALCLAKNQDVNTAFVDYQNRRIKRVTFMVNNSWLYGKAASSSFWAKLLIFSSRLTPEKLVKKQLLAMYTPEY